MFIYRPLHRSQSTFTGSPDKAGAKAAKHGDARRPAFSLGRRKSTPVQRSTIHSNSAGDLPSASAAYDYEIVDVDSLCASPLPPATPDCDRRPIHECDHVVVVTPDEHGTLQRAALRLSVVCGSVDSSTYSVRIT
jgi:hypothetical protein